MKNSPPGVSESRSPNKQSPFKEECLEFYPHADRAIIRIKDSA
jgi:hypothetical protein